MLPGCLPWLFILVFSIKQQSIRHRMKEKLEENISHHVVRMANDEIIWVKKGKEIEVHGKMFDIKTSESKNGMTTFTGLFDEEETALKKQWQEDWQKRSANDNQLLVQLFSLQTIFVESSNNENPAIAQTSVTGSFMSADLPTRYKIILTPPPRA